ncbi:MAG TPA: PAS domain S-box protein [Verrucomicrobiae bacterium]|nr:PAS domain S-box protein [Verrucomicrobiae bacterium]
MKTDALSASALEALLQAPSLAVLAVDVRGHVILWSPSAARLFGWTESEASGHFLPIVPKEQRQAVGDWIQRGLKGEITDALEMPCLRKDGSLVDVSLWSTPLRDRKSKVIGFVCVYADITARRQLQAARWQADDELKRVLASVPDCIYSGEFDSDGRFFYHYYSAAAERILGRSPLFFLAGPEQWLGAVHPEDRPRVREAVDRLRTGQSSSEEAEYRIVLPDGATRWVRDSAVLSPGPDGRRFVNGAVSDITARKQAEEALQQAEAELRQVLDAASDYLWSGEFDPDGRFRYRYFSSAVERITGRPAEFYMAGSESWMSTIHPDDRARMAEISTRLLSGQSASTDNEHRLVLPDGTIRWVRARVSVSPSANGRRRLDGTVSDITARKQAEMALQASTERFRALIEHSFDGIVVVAADATIQFTSESTSRLLGYQPEERQGRSAFEFVHPEDLPRAREVFTRLTQTPGGTLCDQLRYRHKDGSWRWLEISGTNCLSHPHLDGIVLNYRDITRRVQTLQVLHESEERYRTLAESSTDAIFVIDRDDRVQYVNTHGAGMLGRTPDQVIGRPRAEFFPSDISERHRRMLNAVIESGQPVRALDRNHFIGGEAWTDTQLVPLRDGEGAVRAVLGITRDVTERKRAEMALQMNAEWYRALMEHGFDVITVLSRDATIRFASGSISRMLGYQAQEMVGRNALELVHPEDLARVSKVFQRLLQTPQQTLVDRFRYRHKDGSWRWIEGAGTNCLERPQVNGVIVNSRDVTERRQADDPLPESA